MPRVPSGLLASRALARNGLGGGVDWAIAILLSDFQAATFAKSVTDGALAACWHLGKSAMRCLINVGGEPPPLHFKNLYSLFA